MSIEHFGDTAAMGPSLQKEVESQLLNDLRAYDVDPSGLTIDWSDSCQEGHCTQVIDGNLEELSPLSIVTTNGNRVAEGWMDFIHGGGENPLFVFWLVLSVFRNGEWQKVKEAPHIPLHVWSRLPESTKNLCAKGGKYDTRWASDPLVVSWRWASSA